MSVVLERKDKPSWTFVPEGTDLVYRSHYGNEYRLFFEGMRPVVARRVGKAFVSDSAVNDIVRPVSLKILG